MNVEEGGREETGLHRGSLGEVSLRRVRAKEKKLEKERGRGGRTVLVVVTRRRGGARS